MRALLGAKNLDEAHKLLRDVGTGTSDGFSVNFIYCQPGTEPILENIEVAPNSEVLESRLDVHTLEFGESYAHCNK